MLARRSTLNLRNGKSIELPMLVPSFSSKGFGSVTRSSGRLKGTTSYPELEARLALTGQFLDTSFLVSAYDLHHHHVSIPAALYRKPEAIFIDSGGYELSSYFDEMEPNTVPHASLGFELQDYVAALKALPSTAAIIAANADWSTKGLPIEEQVKAAQKLFADFPQMTRNFLVKPVDAERILDIEEIVRHARKFNGFDILGVTEKELGRTLFERLVNLATLRAGLDRQKLQMPIHVWGGLDPLVTPLFFFAGAEIFDGVSWLRYAFVDGLAVCRHSFAALDDGMETNRSPEKLLAVMLAKNLSTLDTVTNRLRQFVDLGASEFSMFDKHGKTFERLYKALRTAVGELKGGH